MPISKVSAQVRKRAQAATMFTIPAPFQGLNTRDQIGILRPDEARLLQNFLPDGGSCKIRPGYQEHATSANTLESIFTYSNASGRSVLAGGNNKIFDVSSGSFTQISNTTITNNYWSTENFGNRIIGVNGVDDPWYWDGSTFAAASFSAPGLTLSSLNTISLVQNRLWFTVNNSADVYYGDPYAVQGTLTKFYLSQIASGGKCVDIGSWSAVGTGGEGPSDFQVFIMDTGEIIVYSGNPQTTEAIVGKVQAPPPIISSFGCTGKIGGELIVLTQSGPIPMSSIAKGLAFDSTQLGPWGKITPSWADDFAIFGNNDGWSMTYHAGVAYFNIITGTDKTKQYVFNTRVQAWTTYVDMPVGQFASAGTSLYFSEYQGGDVFLHQGGTDNGERIIATARQGFSYPLDPSVSKQFTMMKPVIVTDGQVDGQFQLDIDSNESAIDSPVQTVSDASGTVPWDSPWDSEWSSNPVVRRKWRALNAYGVSIAPVVRLYSNADHTKWDSCEILGTPGGVT